MSVKRQLLVIGSWEWTSVLKKVQFIGIMYFSFSVIVGKITYIALSELNVLLQAYPLWLVTIVFFLVGLTMFLNPAIPGVPVYLIGGTVGGERGGLVWVLAWHCLHLLGVFFYQTHRGSNATEILWEKLGTKSLGKTNCWSKLYFHSRHQNYIGKPGMGIAKVSILCGGPDWPTSVLTGILKLSVIQMQIGTLPIIGLVAPCVFAGAFQLKAGVNVLYSSLSTVALGVASASQSLALLAAMYFVDKTVSSRRAELEQVPDDEEVKNRR